MAQQLKTLKISQDVDVPIYEFATHKRKKETTHFPAKDIVLVDGILILSQPKLREIFDYSIFIDCEENERFRRRLRRDTVERGRTEEGVRNQFYSQVKPMHDEFVEPSRAFADLIVNQDQFDQELVAVIQKIRTNKL